MNLLLRFKRAYNTFKKYEQPSRCRTFFDSVGCWWILLNKNNPYQGINFWEYLCWYEKSCHFPEFDMFKYAYIDDDGVQWINSGYTNPLGETVWYLL